MIESTFLGLDSDFSCRSTDFELCVFMQKYWIEHIFFFFPMCQAKIHHYLALIS